MFRSVLRPAVIAWTLVGVLPSYAASSPSSTNVSLLTQAQGLPKDFHEHFFDVPLVVRMTLDGEALGEAIVVLSRDERIELIEFTDIRDSLIDASERDAWHALLQKGVPLGACNTACNNGLVAVHYSLANSEVAILSSNAERDLAAKQHFDLPVGGSTGIIVANNLNISGGQEQDFNGRYALQAMSSLGDWTQTVNGQLTKTGGPDGRTLHSINELHTQTEWHDHFFRLGYYAPSSQGLTRQLRNFGASPDTALGMMFGSSDSLAMDVARPSVYPIYVTANREAVVEVYRNGSLINTQQVQAGLHALDTRPLPGGIYEIEVRLLEDGQVTSTTEELVYKPINWSDTSKRWRYNTFIGRESKLLSNWEEQSEGGMTAGAAVNYLLHPRAVVGLSARQVKGKNQLGSSLDLGLGASTTAYANVYQTKDHGTGMDLHAMHNYGQGNVIFSHNRSWLDNRDTWETLDDGTRVRQRSPYAGQVSNSSLGINHRLDPQNSLSARVSHSDGQVEGVGLDLGWMRNGKLFGSDANWRLSVFDRPGTSSSGNQRNRGVDLSLSMALGREGKRVSASLGTRTSRDGSADRNASVGYQQDVDVGPLTSVSATAMADTYGVGVSGSAQFATAAAGGDVFMQQSSYNKALSGGLNLNSTLVVGGSKAMLSSAHGNEQAGMIVDVISDIDAIELRADDLSGAGAVLKPGRNFVPVTAYRNGTVRFDFEGVHAPAATIQPSSARYHLNKGGVEYRQVHIMKTVTVLGRLLDGNDEPLRGHHVINHASRGVTEADGFFSMELSEGTPTLEVRRNDQVKCRFALDSSMLRREGDVLMAGDLRCVEGTGKDRLASADNLVDVKTARN
ncbi:TcfC E-set like domain-containing protein [Pseudomonas putida]|uniref:TcfC E-set like domain-containing protein n=1 Tax=Pseudomonas putida TaxID=303 RepID=UPI0023632D45|nr:TcfC E-set like domain-containing protein [Pseudomonas putida]MDD2058622.1 TcfC E-set like domain-containing protein [Pseudomonas putida]